jgi:hypothetical protein
MEKRSDVDTLLGNSAGRIEYAREDDELPLAEIEPH